MNSYILIEHEQTKLQKRAWWHSKVPIPHYTHAYFEGVTFTSSFLVAKLWRRALLLCQRDLNDALLLNF